MFPSPGRFSKFCGRKSSVAKNYTLALRKSMTSTATGTKKAPIVTTLESLRKDVLAYLSALGLTPAGAKKLDAAAAARTQEDPLVAALKNLSG